MLEVVLVNIDRIEQFWDMVLVHYVCLTTNAKNLILRSRSVEYLNILIERTFKHFVTKKDLPKSEHFPKTVKI